MAQTQSTRTRSIHQLAKSPTILQEINQQGKYVFSNIIAKRKLLLTPEAPFDNILPSFKNSTTYRRSKILSVDYIVPSQHIPISSLFSCNPTKYAVPSAYNILRNCSSVPKFHLNDQSLYSKKTSNLKLLCEAKSIRIKSKEGRRIREFLLPIHSCKRKPIPEQKPIIAQNTIKDIKERVVFKFKPSVIVKKKIIKAATATSSPLMDARNILSTNYGNRLV